MVPGAVAVEEANWPSGGCSRCAPRSARSSSWSTTSTGPSRRCSTCSSTSRRSPATSRCCWSSSTRPAVPSSAGPTGPGGAARRSRLGPLPDDDAALLFAELTAGTGIGSRRRRAGAGDGRGQPVLPRAARRPARGRREPGRRPRPRAARRADRRAAAVGARRRRPRRRRGPRLPSQRARRAPPGGDPRTARHRARRPHAAQLIRPGAGELPGEAGYRFVHILVRDVVYELLPKASRAELHERYASWLDERAGPRYAELVGYHLEQAHRWHSELRPSATAERRALAIAAVDRLTAAGQAALQRGDLPAGVNLLERTAALLPPDDPARAPLLPELALALVQLGRLPEASA